MNTSLRHWREAATLIVAAARCSPSSARSRMLPPLPHASNLDRSSIRIPLASSQVPHVTNQLPTTSNQVPHASTDFDYDVLLLKRSGKSGFMPNAHVFPGGLADPSDFSSEWMEIYSSFRHLPNFGLRSVRQAPDTRPPMFAVNRSDHGSPISGDVAFRICALRETFEESGVLLALSKLEGETLIERLQDNENSVPAVKEINNSELNRWRALVNEDPSNFLRMCREMQLLPNIWALHEWGNWLTPTGKFRSRFDTAFYICCLEEIPHTLQDQKEIVTFQWSSPRAILASFAAAQLWIAPPQFYELSRMCHYTSLHRLHDYAFRRATEGCEQWLPVFTTDKDQRHVSLLPGDRLYDAVSKGEELEVDSITDPQEDSSLHRLVTTDRHTATLHVTITPKYNHLRPVEAGVYDLGRKWKLG